MQFKFIERVEVDVSAGPEVQEVGGQVVVVAFVPLEFGIGFADVLVFLLHPEGHAGYKFGRFEVGVDAHVLQLDLCCADHQEHVHRVDEFQPY